LPVGSVSSVDPVDPAVDVDGEPEEAHATAPARGTNRSSGKD
jgi:hypothetical protein